MDWTWTFSDWVLLVLILVAILYFYGTSTYGLFKRMEVPHEKPVPFLGNMLGIMWRKESYPEFVVQMYNKFTNHQYSGLYMYKAPYLLIRDPELIKSITIKDFEYFTDHRSILDEASVGLWNKTLVTLKGKRWRDMRATLSPAFTSSKMKTMFVLVSDVCTQVVNHLDDFYKNPSKQDCNITKDGDRLVLELKDFYTRYTNDVIATTAFGIGVDSLKNPNNEFFLMGQDTANFSGKRALKWLLYFIAPDLMKRFGFSLVSDEVTDFFRKLIVNTIATREKEGIVRPDMLQLLMQAKKGSLHDENATDNGKAYKIHLDDDDITAQAFIFFLAGFDTSSTLLSFATLMLAANDDVQNKLREEVDATLEENDGKFTYDAVNNMKYLDMVVSETLRLYPPAAAVDRMCVKPYTLHADPPQEILPGDLIFIPIMGLHRDPKYFDDPEEFNPERFSEENKHKINPATYLPFGLGPRNCIGNRFALMVAKLALVHLLSKYYLQVDSKTRMPIKIAQNGFSMTAEGGFWLGFVSRSVTESKIK